MGNSRTRTIHYKPRMTDMEAFDLCHPKLKHALETALISYDAYAALRYSRKHSVDAAVDWIKSGDAQEAKRPWVGRQPNPCTILGLKPLKPNYAAVR